MHGSANVLTSLFVRGRHTGCACWLLSQKTRAISLICRTNFCWMLIWRLRNGNERDASIEEPDAFVDRSTLMEMYRIPTADKHSFLYVNLPNERDQMFYTGFDQRCVMSA